MGCSTSRWQTSRKSLQIDTTEMRQEMAEYELGTIEANMGKPTLKERLAHLQPLDHHGMESDMESDIKQIVNINQLIREQNWDDLVLAIINGDNLKGSKNIIGEVAKAGNYRMVNWMQEHGYEEVSVSL